MHKASPEETMMMMKMQKDAELDKKIEGLRKKNEALMKRYQEVEEDKKRAEQEGMSLHIRKVKHDDLTITLSKSSNEQRVVTKKSVPKGSNTSDTRSDQEKDPCDPGTRSNLGIGRGKRRQLLITTPGNIKGKRVFVERKDINRPVSPARAKPSPEEEQDALESTTQVKRPPSTKKTVKMQEDTCKQDVKDRCEESPSDQKTTEVSSLLGVSDLNPLTSREEQTEYLRWKKEREEIDRERVARHRNAKGQWKRAWDVEKPDLMYSNKYHEKADRDTHNIGIRNGRRGNLRSEESRGERKGKSLPVVSSKAKGKERLTGRARRWNTKDHEEHLQVYSESGLQAFLEELDALCSPEENNINPETKKQDNASNKKPFVSEVPLKPEEAIGDVTSYRENGNISAGTDDVKISEKKVRFSEELNETAHKISNSITAETEGSCPVQNGLVDDDKQATQATESQNGDDCLAEDKEKVLSETLAGTERKISELSLITEGNEEESREASCPSSGHGGDVYRSEADQTRPVEVTKTCSEEVIDSSLSVLNLDSGETRSDCSSSTDMARENGKVV